MPRSPLRQSLTLLGAGLPAQAGAWTPAAITGLLTWFEADTLNGFADGDPVGSWQTAGGPANTATAGGTARPLYRPSGINGIPEVECTGTQAMALTTPFMLGSAFTVYVVINAASSFFAFAATAPLKGAIGKLSNYVYAIGDSNAASSASKGTLAATYAARWRRDATANKPKFTGTGKAELQLSAVIPLDISVGKILGRDNANQFSTGRASLLIAISGDIADTADETALKAYIQGKYAVTF